MDSPIRLHANENLHGPSPKAVEAITATASEANFYATPNIHDDQLLNKLVASIGGGLTKEHFVLGNGSGDVLRMITQTFISDGDEVLIPLPTFAAYKRLASLHRGKLNTVPLTADHQIDLEGLIAAITPQTKLIFLCNPNNPTGIIVNHDEMGNFLSQVPDHVVVVVDEAYVHFVEDPTFPRMTEFIARGDNVIVTRTFSKVYGLAGLRVGYGYGKLPLIEPVQQRYIPFDTGRMAFNGAAAALSDEAHIVTTLDNAKASKALFYDELSKMGIKYIKSEAFFILLRDLPIPAPDFVAAVAEHGVLIRHTDVFDMPGFVRISIGRLEDNKKCIEAIRQVLNDRGLLPQ